MSDRQCAKCDKAAAGPGGVLCGACITTVSDQLRTYWTTPHAAESVARPPEAAAP